MIHSQTFGAGTHTPPTKKHFPPCTTAVSCAAITRALSAFPLSARGFFDGAVSSVQGLCGVIKKVLTIAKD